MQEHLNMMLPMESTPSHPVVSPGKYCFSYTYHFSCIQQLIIIVIIATTARDIGFHLIEGLKLSYLNIFCYPTPEQYQRQKYTYPRHDMLRLERTRPALDACHAARTWTGPMLRPGLKC